VSLRNRGRPPVRTSSCRTQATLPPPRCRRRGLGGGQPGRLVAAGLCSAEEAIRYALSQDIASLVTGIDSMKVLEQNLGIARGFQKMSEAEQKALRDRVKAVAGDGRHERFKSTQLFDGPHHQKQHGLTKADVEG